ncbi:MAG: response regulator transcription factor [Spirochaetaceae bacterium]|nr:response regulator transcription factor [Spirochaetaceae bacterium]
MQAKILIIEDVKEMSDLIALYLGNEGMDTKQAETAEEALEILNDYNPSLIVLDLNLPGMDGFEFLHHFRKKFDIPVLIVSARDADEDIIAGLGYGADEFVTKPFSPRVLVARIRALIRRSQDSSNENASVYTFGPYVLDENAFVLKEKKDDGTFMRIPLSAKEYDILVYLTKNEGKPLAPEVIFSNVWKNVYGDLSGVAVYIQRLRKKLEKDPANPVYLETVFGMGYRFNNPTK